MGNGYVAAGALLLAGLAGAGGYFHGLDTGRTRERAENFKAITAAQDAADRLRREIADHAMEAFSADQRRQDTVREIRHESREIVERPVFRNICIDPDGVRLLDRAADAANGHDPAASSGDAARAAESPAL